MTGIKPSDHGIVVDHKESGVRYAVSDRNYNERIHHKVRDLRPGESVLSYRPRPKGSLGDQASTQGSPGAQNDAGDSSATPAQTSQGTSPENQTEGSSAEGTKGK